METIGMILFTVFAGPKKKPLPRKCSTCADRDCRQRGRICDWKHCKDWKEGPRKA